MAYTVGEASDLLSLSRAHVYRLIDLGKINTVLIGRSRRITSRQLDEFVRGLEQQNGPVIDTYKLRGAKIQRHD
ncbi:MAG: helix-turn-helix domain-containing protein [Armatimonadetes bacterium]|nr:helix-turn-helix domain-containing protein [Armatimonadota bacterium]